MITDIEQLDLTKAYTFKNYLSWKFHERVELLRGCIAKMSPAPTSTHQEISSNLYGSLWNFLRKKPCKVVAAPFDVYLPSIKGEGETVVQPGLCVVCDASKIKKQGCVGAPDLVIEILSLGNSRKEMTQKYQIYEQAGVKEYWRSAAAGCVSLQASHSSIYISGRKVSSITCCRKNDKKSDSARF